MSLVSVVLFVVVFVLVVLGVLVHEQRVHQGIAGCDVPTHDTVILIVLRGLLEDHRLEHGIQVDQPRVISQRHCATLWKRGRSRSAVRGWGNVLIAVGSVQLVLKVNTIIRVEIEFFHVELQARTSLLRSRCPHGQLGLAEKDLERALVRGGLAFEMHGMRALGNEAKRLDEHLTVAVPRHHVQVGHVVEANALLGALVLEEADYVKVGVVEGGVVDARQLERLSELVDADEASKFVIY